MLQPVKMEVVFFLVQIVLFPFADCHILTEIDLTLLEGINYCQLSYEFHEEDLDIDDFQGYNYISLMSNDCETTLIIRNIETILEQDHICFSDHQFIKDHMKTFLFLNYQHQMIMDENIYDKFSCLAERQPYFFVATINASLLMIEEFQVFLKKRATVAKYIRTPNELIIDDWTIQSIDSRRSDFRGKSLTVYYDELTDEDFSGYNGELATILAQHFNFTMNTIAIESYGIKLPNGTFSGTVGKINENKLDVGMLIKRYLLFSFS